MHILRHVVYFLLTSAAVTATVFAAATGLDRLGLLALLQLTPVTVAVSGLVLAWLGAALSLALAKSLAGWALSLRPYSDDDRRALAGDLPAALARRAPALGLAKAPGLVVYGSAAVNACTIGWRRDGAVLAVSAGLLTGLEPGQAEAVLVQVMARLAVGDTPAVVALTGLLAPFSLFPARLLAGLLGTSLRTSDEETPSDPVETLVVVTLETLLTPLGSLLVRQFDRGCERRADRRAAQLVGTAALVEALSIAQARALPPHRERFTGPLTFGADVPGFLRLLSYHVPFAARVAALRGK